MKLSEELRKERKEYLREKLRLRHIPVEPLAYLGEDPNKKTLSFLAELHFGTEKRFQNLAETTYDGARQIMLDRLFECIYGPVFDVIKRLEAKE